MTDELIAFIEARLTDDEAEAHRYRPMLAAAHGAIESWVADRRWNNETPPYYDYRFVRTQLGAARSYEVVRSTALNSEMITSYIARFGSPVRVMREIAAKRALLALHRETPERRETPEMSETLLLLAMTWADHDDYDPAWAFECELRENNAGKIVLRVIEDEERLA